MKYWYKFFCGECPLCGRGTSYKERQYSPKPVDPCDRYERIPDSITYDGCLG